MATLVAGAAQRFAADILADPSIRALARKVGSARATPGS
jgi:hypothetical protein